jgi:hypothetical protein
MIPRGFADTNTTRATNNNSENVGFEVFTAVVMKSAIFWDITPGSPFKVKRYFGGIFLPHLQGRKRSRARYQLRTADSRFLCLPLAFTLVSCSVYSLKLKMELILSSKTSGGFQRTRWRYIPEASILHFWDCLWLNCKLCNKATTTREGN